jgi:autotransporter-associated beta strand protein
MKILLRSILTCCILSAAVWCHASPPPGYYLNWSDEFNSNSLNTNIWFDHRYYDHTPISIYNTCIVTNGCLMIPVYTLNGTNYAGILSTEKSFLPTYGYFETSMQSPTNDAAFPAFWLQGQNGLTNNMPATNGVEIDIIENCPSANWADNGVIWNGYGIYKQDFNQVFAAPVPLAGFHTYGLLWTPTNYTFYVDGNITWQTNIGVSQKSEYILLQNGFTIYHPPGPPANGYGTLATTTCKAYFDYVRYYAPVPNVTWDANTGSAGAQDGSGSWESGKWWNGTNDISWSDAPPYYGATLGAGGTAGTVTLSNPHTADSLTFNPVVSGSYTLAGVGTLTILEAGINANASATLNVPVYLGTNQTWAVAGNQTLAINGSIGAPAPVILSLTGAGTVKLGNPSQMSTNLVALNFIDSVNDTTLAISNGTVNAAIAGAGNVTTLGSGTLTLNGTNTYSGTTTVGQGTLLVNGALGTNTVMVATNAFLGGAGTINGNVILNSGALATNRQGSPLTISGSLVMNNNTLYVATPSALGVGDYTLMTYSSTGSSGSFNPTPVISGAGLAANTIGTIVTGGGVVYLHIISSTGGVATTTSVTSLANPSTFGQSVTLTATIVPASGTSVPSGTVQFLTAGSDLGSPVGVTAGASPNGTASISTAALTVSGSPIVVTAVYISTGNFIGSSGTLPGGQVVHPAAATVTLGNLIQTYSGTGKSVTATTIPSGLAVTLTYNGSASAPTNVGSYTVIGSISDLNYAGSVTNTLVIQPILALTWSGVVSSNWNASSSNWVDTATHSTNFVYYDGDLVTFDDYGSANTNIALNTIVQPGNITFSNSTMNYTFSGSGGIAGSASLTKYGSGTLTFSCTNSYTGYTTVNGGKVNVSGNQSAATGSWLLPQLVNTATVNFQSGTTVAVGAGNQIQLGVAIGGYSGNSFQTLNVAGTVSNSGSLAVGRCGILNVSNGGVWNQGGSMTNMPTTYSGYNASITVASGGAFNYTGTSPIVLSPDSGGAGSGILTIGGGTFTTTQGFINSISPAASLGGYGQIILTNGGSLVLAANIPQLTAGVNTNSVPTINLGTGGGVINTAGYSTAITNIIGGTGGLTKLGAGTLTLGASNSYVGTTTVSGGTLLVNGTLGTNTVTVATNALLSGMGTIGGSVLVQSGGIIQPGNESGAGNMTCGTLNFGDNANARTYSQFTIAADGTISATTLNIAGTNVINLLDASLAFGTNTLMAYTGAIGGSGLAGFKLGTLPALPTNATAYLRNSGSTLQLVVAPLVAPVIAGTMNYGAAGFSFSFSGINGQGYHVLTSTNVSLPLTNWVILTNGTFGSGPVNFTDSAAANTQQFYRVSSP